MNKIIKIILWIVCCLLILFVIASAVLPIWISSPSGTQTSLRWLNRHLEGKLSVEKVSLSWWNGQNIKNLHYADKSGKTILSLSKFSTDSSLLYLVFGGRCLKKTEIVDPYYLFRGKTEEEKEKEEKAIREGKKKRNEIKSFVCFREPLVLKNGTLELAADPDSPIKISDILINYDPVAKRLIFQSVTSKGPQKGTLSIEADLKNEWQSSIHIKDIPIAILDQLGDTQLYTEGLGKNLSAILNMTKRSGGGFNIMGSAQSENLHLSVDGFLDQGHLILTSKTTFEFQITPSFFKQIIDEKTRGDWELASKTPLVGRLEKGEIPLPLKKRNLKNVVLQGSAKINRAELHHSTLGSYSLKQFDISLSTQEALQLAFQGHIQGKESTDLKGHLTLSPERELLFNVDCKGFPATLLELVSHNLAKNVKFLLGTLFDLQAEGSIVDGIVDSNVRVSSANTEAISHITGEWDHLNFEVSGTQQIHGDKTKILGSFFNFTLNGEGNFKNEHFSIPSLKGNAYNPYLEFDLHGNVGEEGKPFSFELLQLVTTGSIKKLPLEENLNYSSLRNGTLFAEVNGPKNTITGRVESQAIEANFVMNHFIHDGEVSLSQSDSSFSCELHNFPVSVASPFIAEDIDLALFLGKSITLSAKGSYSPAKEPRFSLDLNAQGTGFSTSLAIAIDDTLLVRQNRPSYISWDLSPERFTALLKLFRVNPHYEPTYILTRTAPVELHISEFICPTQPSKNVGHFLCQSGFVGDLKLGSLILRSRKTNESITFQSIRGAIKGANFSDAIDLAFSGDILAANIPPSEKSALSFEGQMLNFWTKEGKFNRSGLTVKGILGVDLLPVRQTTELIPLDNETRAIVRAVLGDLVNARVYGEISQLAGPLTLDIKSSNFKAKLPLTLHNNAIYLREAMDAEITLTQAVNETLLADIAPLFITGAYSDRPLRVRIDPQGFVLPIKPYSLSQVQIGSAVIDIGKIRVRNGGQLQALMNFLEAKDIAPDGTMDAWFTPIYMNLHNGIASYNRFDALLANTAHIAMWGSVNLVNGKVKMTLGIAPTTLQQRFKITGLSRSELFQIKMRGTTNKLELDWSSASTRIAFLVARTAGGQLGNLIGGILEQLVPKLGEEPSPPPTTQPFPWESYYSSELH